MGQRIKRSSDLSIYRSVEPVDLLTDGFFPVELRLLPSSAWFGGYSFEKLAEEYTLPLPAKRVSLIKPAALAVCLAF
jgi:hypothetical protein